MSTQEEKTENVVCVTCSSTLPPDTEIHYFAQSPLFPKKDDLGFTQELFNLIDHMRALFDVIGYSYEHIEDDDTIRELGQLGFNVAAEARRCLGRVQQAEDALWQKWRDLQAKEDERRALR